MRTKDMLLTTAVIGLAVVTGVSGVGGTWALWNVSVRSDAGTVRAADFDITVNDTSIPADGSHVSVELDEPAALTPSTPVYAAISVANTTNASAPFTVRATLSAPSARPTQDGLEDHLVLRTAPKSADTCAASDYGTVLPGADLSARVEKDGAKTFCLEVGVKASAPASLSGTTATITLPLSIEQIPAGA